MLVAASIVSITLNPLLFRAIGPVDRWLARRQRRPVMPVEPAMERSPATHRAVVVGYGPVGRTVARLLRENDIAPTIIEMNADTVKALRSEGVDAIHGDATNPDVLAAAGSDTARSFIVSVADLPGLEEAVRIARRHNPSVQTLARATTLREVPALRAAGADTVMSGEGEVALAFTAAILRRLGATPEQVDKERARVREELGNLVIG